MEMNGQLHPSTVLLMWKHFPPSLNGRMGGRQNPRALLGSLEWKQISYPSRESDNDFSTNMPIHTNICIIN
jgi:hypothetical protein